MPEFAPDHRLTDAGFWDGMWEGRRLPSFPDGRHSFDRCLGRELRRALSGKRGELLEIGCAPGRWMAFCALELGFRVSGIEYSRAGLAATDRNLALLGVQGSQVVAGDFFSIAPEPKYDAVLSLGFVEHFDDPDAVVARHAAWLRPGGRMVIGVPNFRGIYAPIQRILDVEVLHKHNLATMETEWLHRVGENTGLDMISVGYLGSFEPDLPVPGPRPRSWRQTAVMAALHAARTLRKMAVWDGLNHPFFSAYLLAVLEKRAPK